MTLLGTSLASLSGQWTVFPRQLSKGYKEMSAKSVSVNGRQHPMADHPQAVCENAEHHGIVGQPFARALVHRSMVEGESDRSIKVRQKLEIESRNLEVEHEAENTDHKTTPPLSPPKHS